MGNYWLISVPSAGSTKQEKLNLVKAALAEHGAAPLADVAPFVIPDLKVGTLDSLVLLSDDLAKVDTVAEASVNKLIDTMKMLLNNDTNQVQSTLVVHDKSPDAYVKAFSWNTMKYRVDKPLRETVEAIQQEVSHVDTMMKTRLSTYNQCKANLIALDRKMMGNLAVRSLVDVVKKEHFVLDSEYLTTLLIAVPRCEAGDGSYNNTFSLITAPSRHFLSSTRLSFSQVPVPDFVPDLPRIVPIPPMTLHTCFPFRVLREHKFNEKDLENSRKQRADLMAMEKEQWSQLLRLTKTNFGEIFSCWLHIKAIRIFVESVLRHGLPPDFMSAVIEPRHKQEKKVRDQLNALFGEHRGKRDKQLEQEFEEMSLLAGVEKEFYAYVNFPLAFQI
ncbi:hypothetical protein AMAG_13231 [Allomyces macrogynus ATCC 38327]|uniref:V-type proton ATPase subunit C n=1 Tax=Allomyces macrogynus (strain ATCC 38327) TaxID=578462 RepID=A0A0L0SZU8_ALLM3|nr:hypothetical protein AMAG_13231 [Allomyces macrogynus ATCC 38327]|eukprot:KNE68058.1 hypothetical protein AMAG_13231 [Allomyces macrogynus ATCC 38327]